MKRKSRPVVLFLLHLGMLAAAGRAAGAPARVQTEVWAQAVASFKTGPGMVGVNFSDRPVLSV